VLAVTFTRYAAAQMRDQVRAVSGDAADEINVSTLHALGYGIVRAEADHLGLGRNVGVALPSYVHHLVHRAMQAAGLDERWDLDGLVREIERAKGCLVALTNTRSTRATTTARRLSGSTASTRRRCGRRTWWT
jgi:superfamily I DNA/RNA helicase